ncbi:MAG: hypothetical protein IAC51_08275 [bacterium]|uniref:Uncharacterized protein n=1 Tax=Candidatus Aphodosoma intestinipullorum TaxID=2840674 RepID=A0A940DKV3_9BACT|nr:hypothetical protein [Candidatus Aphodosoma intestinipullorum]
MKTIKFLLLCSCAVLLLTGCPNNGPETGAKFQYLNLNVTELTLSHSETYSLIPEANEGADLLLVEWASSDTMVEVDMDGNLTVKGWVSLEPEVTITASVSGENTESGQTLTATCTVRVVNEQKLITFNTMYGPWNERTPMGIKADIPVIFSDGREDTLPGELYKAMLIIQGGSSGIIRGDDPRYVNWVSVPGDFVIPTSDWYCALVYYEGDTLSLNPAGGDTMRVVSQEVFADSVRQYFISAGSMDDEKVMATGQLTSDCLISSWIWRFTDNQLGMNPCSFIREGSYFVVGNGQYSDVNVAWPLLAYEVFSSPFYNGVDESGSQVILHPTYRLRMDGQGNYEDTDEVVDETVTSAPAANWANKQYRVGYSNQELRYRENMMKTLNYAWTMRINEVVSAMK